ncbi:MAG: DUF455 family protein [Polyangiaceae bacterium]|nr:DUF455 family protein [Polyangiaceae bacterium]
MSLAPEAGTVERWAWDYVLSTSLEHKLNPPPPPDVWSAEPVATRIAAPGRPPELRVVPRAEKLRGFRSPRGRARAMHTFFHHELQAAELMAWALLAFADSPRQFREGLLRMVGDETRHMRMYAAEIDRLGQRIGDFAVRDWFWQRVPGCREVTSFVAVMGLGLESANLDHSAALARELRSVGDEQAARVQDVVGLEEIAHVRFGVRWFTAFAGRLDFDSWRRALPAPLSPLLMRGRPLRRDARERAGQPPEFIDELERWTPEERGP